jgi:formylmethanofuran dehydrogenase subunit A
VFKDGALVAERGEVKRVTRGALHAVKPEFDRGIERKLEDYFRRYQTVSLASFVIGDDEVCECGRASRLEAHACRRHRDG